MNSELLDTLREQDETMTVLADRLREFLTLIDTIPVDDVARDLKPCAAAYHALGRKYLVTGRVYERLAQKIDDAPHY